MSAISTDRARRQVEQWFGSHGWIPFPFQREVWDAYLAGESGLLHAATGTGKTLAIWLAPVIVALGAETRGGPGLRVLWITPLRALAGDTALALREPIEALGLDWRVETRTGDTSSSVKARQRKRPPTALVTTPESLALLQTYDEPAQWADLDLVVVDEWHELMGTKRGVQVELSLARLRAVRPELRIWGLSATIGNLEVALRALVGVRGERPVRTVRGVEPKGLVIDSLIPPTLPRFPWAGHLGTQMVGPVADAVAEGDTAIIFTNTRSQAELWYRALLAARPEWNGLVGLHHGSIDRKQRELVEERLRAGELRCVIATSSLDLGVDFSPVDRVLQIGSPKGIARIIQRAGRSGHRPGAVSRVTCVPTNALELLEVAAVRDGIAEGAIEARSPVRRPLDVLAQHLVTVALGGGFEAGTMLAEVRSTHTFAELSDDEWRWTLDFVSHGGATLVAYAEYARVVDQGGVWRVVEPMIARRHRQSIGTIVGDAQIQVRYLRGRTLGSIEESFLARLRPGDRFLFAGTPLEFVRVRDLVAWVRRAPNLGAAVPRWMGTRLPLSDELATMLRRRLGAAALGTFDGAELEALRPLLEIQARWSRIPRADELLVERVRTREGHHLFWFPFEGRLVHEGLAALIAFRLSRLTPISFTMSANDYGFELLSSKEPPMDDGIVRDLLDVERLLEDIAEALNATEMARRQFREISRVAGLVFPGLPRAGKTVRQVQASSGLIFDVFARHDPENLLLAQAHREVLERQLEASRLRRALDRLAMSKVVITEPKRTTPLAFPLLVDRTREKVTSESLMERIARMQVALEKAAG